MKASEGLTRAAPTLGVFLTFCAGAALQAIAMRRTGMAVTYLIVLGLEAITALFFGAAFLGEKVTLSTLVAVVLVLSGIALLRRPA